MVASSYPDGTVNYNSEDLACPSKERSKRVAIGEFILAVALVVFAAVTGIWFAYIAAAVAVLFAVLYGYGPIRSSMVAAVKAHPDHKEAWQGPQGDWAFRQRCDQRHACGYTRRERDEHRGRGRTTGLGTEGPRHLTRTSRTATRLPRAPSSSSPGRTRAEVHRPRRARLSGP